MLTSGNSKAEYDRLCRPCVGRTALKADDIRTVAVVGAGTMGAGIAGAFARGGYAVRLADRDEACLARGMKMLAVAQATLLEARLLSRRDAAAAMKRIRPVAELKEAC